MPVTEVVAAAVAIRPSRRAVLLAIDGRGSAGKTTVAHRICEAAEDAAVIHTDDIAWPSAIGHRAGASTAAPAVSRYLTVSSC
jgi:hypothetical protein